MKVGLNKGSQELPFRNFRNSCVPRLCETFSWVFCSAFSFLLICVSCAAMVSIQDLAWRSLESCDIDDPIQKKLEKCQSTKMTTSCEPKMAEFQELCWPKSHNLPRTIVWDRPLFTSHEVRWHHIVLLWLSFKNVPWFYSSEYHSVPSWSWPWTILLLVNGYHCRLSSNSSGLLCIARLR